MSNNLLSMTGCGTSGVNTGNLIHQSLHQSDKQYDAVFDGSKKTITVLNSSDLSPETLNKMVYSKEVSFKYEGWYPEVTEKRDEDGNLLIKLSVFFPKNAIFHSSSPAVDTYSALLKKLRESQVHQETKTSSSIVTAKAEASPKEAENIDFDKSLSPFLNVSKILARKIEDVLLKPEVFLHFHYLPSLSS